MDTVTPSDSRSECLALYLQRLLQRPYTHIPLNDNDYISIRRHLFRERDCEFQGEKIQKVKYTMEHINTCFILLGSVDLGTIPRTQMIQILEKKSVLLATLLAFASRSPFGSSGFSSLVFIFAASFLPLLAFVDLPILVRIPSVWTKKRKELTRATPDTAQR